jgi:hypothetical protein
MHDSLSSAVPTRWSAIIFAAKASGLQLRRGVRNWRSGMERHRSVAPDEYSFVWAESRTPLWDEERVEERGLQAGKVQNLRCATRQLRSILVPRGKTFSFWMQIGKATRRRGYTQGRLLREGCLLPAVGGGLCQLSNALYEVALDCDFEIVERYAHSQIIPGSTAQTGRDATVAWNYIDLRFRPKHDVVISAQLTRDELIVRVLGKTAKPRVPAPLTLWNDARPTLDIDEHSCASCEQSSCFRQRSLSSSVRHGTAWVLDEAWPEFATFVGDTRQADDILAVPLSRRHWVAATAKRTFWNTEGFSRCIEAPVHAVMRSVRSRQHQHQPGKRFSSQFSGTEQISRVLGRALSPEVTHIRVAQSLLPFLWRDGVLGGRSFEVLMTRLPLHELHRRLDSAALLHPSSHTLREFRAPQWLVEAEREAVAAAERIITPHCEIASLFSNRVLVLPWHQPKASPQVSPQAPLPTRNTKQPVSRFLARRQHAKVLTKCVKFAATSAWKSCFAAASWKQTVSGTACARAAQQAIGCTT